MTAIAAMFGEDDGTPVAGEWPPVRDHELTRHSVQ
jgi:hypothetical protein